MRATLAIKNMQPAWLSIIAVVLMLFGPLSASANDKGVLSQPRLEDDAVITTDGYRLPLAKWLPEGEPCRVVLGLHGFNDYRQTFDNLASALSENCTAFYAYDHRGFGETVDRGQWPGRARLVNDATNVANLLRERYPDLPLYMIGESMGGTITILTLAQDHPPPVDGAVLLAPGVWGRSVQPWYQRLAMWISIRVMPQVKIPNDIIDVDPSDDPEVLEYWRENEHVLQESRVTALYGVANLMDAAVEAADRLQHKLLVLYGGKDEIIPKEGTCLLLKQLEVSSAEWDFVYYPDGYHLLTRYSGQATTIEDIQAWLQSSEASLPSGNQLSQSEAKAALCED